MIDSVLEKEIRKHSLILTRLQNIKDMKDIINKTSRTYKNYLNDELFIDNVKYRLSLEEELLAELIKEKTFSPKINGDRYEITIDKQ